MSFFIILFFLGFFSFPRDDGLRHVGVAFNGDLTWKDVYPYSYFSKYSSYSPWFGYDLILQKSFKLLRILPVQPSTLKFFFIKILSLIFVFFVFWVIIFKSKIIQDINNFESYTETTGTLLSLFVWTIFGAVFVVPAALLAFDWRVVGYAVLSLTLLRMLPVGLSLLGLRFRRDTAGVMGWFGPRGLASVIFGLLAFDELTAASKEAGLLASVVTWTILLSVLAHGLSAQPLAAWYARRLKQAPATAPELVDVPEIQVRSDVLLSMSKKAG